MIELVCLSDPSSEKTAEFYAPYELPAIAINSGLRLGRVFAIMDAAVR